jgi:hypothetical protein
MKSQMPNHQGYHRAKVFIIINHRPRCKEIKKERKDMEKEIKSNIKVQQTIGQLMSPPEGNLSKLLKVTV